MPRQRHPGPPPDNPLPIPPNLTKIAKLMWRHEDIMEEVESDPYGMYKTMEEDLRRWDLEAKENEAREKEARGKDVQQTPPTPKMKSKEPVLPENDPRVVEPLSPRKRSSNVISQYPEEGPEDIGKKLEKRPKAPKQQRKVELENDRKHEIYARQASGSGGSGGRGSVRRSSASSSSSRTRRNNEEQTGKNYEQFINSIDERESNRPREHPSGDEGGVLLKPLTPIVVPEESSQASGRDVFLEQKRGVRTAETNYNRERPVWMKQMAEEDLVRYWGQDAQEDLYGDTGINHMAHTRMLYPYPQPTRDEDEISQHINDMTINDHQYDYHADGRPGPVDLLNVNYFTDVTNIQDFNQYQEAREAKAFAGFAMFTERATEIEVLRRLKIHGFLKDDVEVKYGWQEEGPHGAIAWLTREGQEIGGRMREQYEHERAVEEARKQAQAEVEFYQWFEEQGEQEFVRQQQEEYDKRHDSKVSANSSNRPSVVRAPRSSHPYLEHRCESIAENVAKRRDSDDSIKTAYAADEPVPDSAYRSRADLSPNLSLQQPQRPTVIVPETFSVSEDTPISPLTTE